MFCNKANAPFLHIFAFCKKVETSLVNIVRKIKKLMKHDAVY